ncbi:MAG TPA: hypothetical protein VFL74_04610 [Sphingomicrobium sp.]|nr:hypothetical protein [Sphingomicrobium sp.]
MLRWVPLLFLLVASCGSGHSQQRGSTVTITLPPPKAMPAPGFSESPVPRAA